MSIAEKTEALQDKHLREWLSERKKVDDELSQAQSMFCACGRLATGLHERNRRKFNQRVNNETAKRLSHLLQVEK